LVTRRLGLFLTIVEVQVVSGEGMSDRAHQEVESGN
jgi:hypothetical protein